MVLGWLKKEIHLCRHCKFPHLVFGHYAWQQHLRLAKWKERAEKEIRMNQSALMMHKSKAMLVKAKFRPRIRCNGRLTNRIGCMKERRESGVGNVSFDRCKDGCKDAIKIEEDGVWCSFGQEEEK